MSGMTGYYVSRAVLSVALGALFVLAGSAWWVGLIAGALAFLLFLLAPHSGRYVVDPRLGPAALQRDERTQSISAAAARNAYVVSMLALGGIIVYFGLVALGDVPIMVLDGLLILGVLVYYVSDFLLRRNA